MASPARIFPTYATHPLDESSGVLDMKELFALLNDMAKWSLNNTAVTLAHTGGGTANALACESTPAISAYAADQLFWLVPAATNTGAVTIEIDGLATRAVVDKAGDALTGGELVTGNAYLMWDNGTHIRIMTPDASSGSGASLTFTRIINADDCTGASYELTDLEDYTEIYIGIDGAQSAADNNNYYATVSDDNGSTYETSGYEGGQSEAGFFTQNNWDNGNALPFWVHIVRLGGTGVRIEGGNLGRFGQSVAFDNGNVIDAIKLAPSSGSVGGSATLTAWAR